MKYKHQMKDKTLHRLLRKKRRSVSHPQFALRICYFNLLLLNVFFPLKILNTTLNQTLPVIPRPAPSHINHIESFLCSAQSWGAFAHARHNIPLMNKFGPARARLSMSINEEKLARFVSISSGPNGPEPQIKTARRKKPK